VRQHKKIRRRDYMNRLILILMAGLMASGCATLSSAKLPSSDTVKIYNMSKSHIIDSVLDFGVGRGLTPVMVNREEGIIVLKGIMDEFRGAKYPLITTIQIKEINSQESEVKIAQRIGDEILVMGPICTPNYIKHIKEIFDYIEIHQDN
jgi:hypothetical protein